MLLLKIMILIKYGVKEKRNANHIYTKRYSKHSTNFSEFLCILIDNKFFIYYFNVTTIIGIFTHSHTALSFFFTVESTYLTEWS